MIFLCLLPSPIPLFHYLKITRRTIFLSILVAREHMAMYQPKESQVREEQEARALASKRPHLKQMREKRSAHCIMKNIMRKPTLLYYYIGIAPMGGALPPAWRWQLLIAIEAGLDIISGLHFFISDDEELRTAAAKRGVTIWDVRRPPEKNRVAQYIPHRPGSHTVLLVGSDCATGKMTAALELDREARRRGMSSAFVATGQTGIIISGNGLPVDRIISDFVAGMVEEMVLDFTNKYDWVFVEGQGALNHPGYSPVTLGLIHGSMPDAMIFSHIAGATTIEGYDHCPLPSLSRMIQFNEDTVSWVRPERPCKVAGLALVTHHLSEQAARDAVKQAEDETGLPATDVLRFGAGVLMDALSKL